MLKWQSQSKNIVYFPLCKKPMICIKWTIWSILSNFQYTTWMILTLDNTRLYLAALKVKIGAGRLVSTGRDYNMTALAVRSVYADIWCIFKSWPAPAAFDSHLSSIGSTQNCWRLNQLAKYHTWHSLSPGLSLTHTHTCLHAHTAVWQCATTSVIATEAHIWTHTHAVSSQCSLINEMACSLSWARANQVRGHKSLPAGDAEGHRPLFIGNFSSNYPDRESDTLTTGRHHRRIGLCVFVSWAD